ncbi:MAG: poly-gamma-glutamate hydrolase family protein [Acidimicrobiia bacterium]|nr:poly-gamma-glutamate hydrolase family protein [Acidimicrobiia bacterium]
MRLAALLEEPGVQEQLSLRGPVGLMALHGGGQDRVTDAIAAAAAARSAGSLYAVVQPATLRWHIPSYRYSPDESLRLRQFIDHVRIVISVHGYGVDSWRMDWRPPGFESTRLGRFHVREAFLIGGRNRGRAGDLADRLRQALPGYEVWDDLERVPPKASGMDLRNPVNLPAEGGVQVECPPRVRGLGPRPAPEDTVALIGVLAEAAAAWGAELGSCSS